ncbi:helicase-associated domain-containing protein [Amycolatopsis samaneae]|uniref:Helicase-associated domain-containing protein n=1 Tax=Amycolatopsis samaneae TaxID=664691 RepID=A0ABW5GIE3_9PSEU
MSHPDDDEERWLQFTEQEAQLNLRVMLELCAAGEVKVSDKTLRPSAATIRTITEHLVNGDFYPDEAMAAFAWPLLLQAGGLAKPEKGRLQLTSKGHDALNKPAAETVRLLWQRWLSHAVIDEFSRIEQIKGQRAANVLTAAKPRRQLVSKALAHCPVGEWIAVDTLFTTMRRGNMSPTIARSEMALWKLYLEDREYGSLGYDGYYQWSLLEGRYTLAVLFEYAGTLGLVDLDYVDPVGARDDFQHTWGGDSLDTLSRYDGLVAIRLTALGAYVLGVADTYQPSAVATAVQSLKVLPNLDVVATGKVPAHDQLLLTAFAEHTADHVWTVSAISLLTALESGRDLAEFASFLTERTDHELPGTLTTLLSDVGRRAGQLTDLGHCRVIECADLATAALIARDRSLRTLCRPIGGRHLAVQPAHEAKFRKALLKLGYVMPGPQ